MYTDRIIDQILVAWEKENKSVTNFFSAYPDEFYSKELAPGKNRAIYLLGHLIAVNDGLLPLFGLSERLYPEYENIFIRSADHAVENIPSIGELKTQWKNINQVLEGHFNKMSADDWMSRHNSVPPADFEREPWRNKLNVILNRTSHQSYHFGQLVLMKEKAD